MSFSLDGNEVENQTLAGSAAIDGTGNSFDNRIVGNGGNNVLNGGSGSDLLTGGGGSDVFEFTSRLVAGDIDTITDFSVDDTIRLSSAFFSTIGGTGTLSADQFAANASGTAQDDTTGSCTKPTPANCSPTATAASRMVRHSSRRFPPGLG